MNWSEVERAALQLLEHPESYPGLAALAPSRARLRLWRYPSFEPFASWAVLGVKGGLFLRRVVWDHAPTPLPDPTTFGSEAFLEEGAFTAILAELQSIAIPPFLPSSQGGLDGTEFGLEVSDFLSSTRLRWWEDHPPAWAPLRHWHERTISVLEALLPLHAAGATRR